MRTVNPVFWLASKPKCMYSEKYQHPGISLFNRLDLYLESYLFSYTFRGKEKQLHWFFFVPAGLLDAAKQNCYIILPGDATARSHTDCC